jgi:hypothetical protein
MSVQLCSWLLFFIEEQELTPGRAKKKKATP